MADRKWLQNYTFITPIHILQTIKSSPLINKNLWIPWNQKLLAYSVNTFIIFFVEQFIPHLLWFISQNSIKDINLFMHHPISHLWSHSEQYNCSKRTGVVDPSAMLAQITLKFQMFCQWMETNVKYISV